MKLAVLAFGAALLGAPAALAQAPAPSAYDQAVQDRLAGRLDKAAEAFRALAAANPQDADLWLNLGLTLSAKGDLAGAETAVARGLQIAPAYGDLHLAHARLALFRGQPAEARRRLQPALAGPSEAEARALLDQIRAAEREQAAAAWRVDATVTYSRLSQGLPAWRELDLSVGRRLDRVSGVSLGIEQTNRFDVANTFLHAEYDRRFGGWSAYAGYGGSPDAVYRPRSFVQAGLAAPSARLGGGWTLAGEVNATYGAYPSGPVSSVQPVATLAFGERASLAARYVFTRNEQGRNLGGYALQGSAAIAPRLRLTLGYGDAPDTSTGQTVKVRNYNAGLAWDVGGFTLRLGGARETGRAYTRDDYVLGLTRRF